jgi:hypothetical protein
MIPATPFLRFYRMKSTRRRLLLRAGITVAAASAAVALLPFRLAIRFGSVDLGPIRACNVADSVWAVQVIARRVLWRAKCIEQGLALQRMLRSVGVNAVLHYGVRHHPQSGELEAHVWVTVEGEAVIGGAEAAGFTSLATYP